VDRAVLRVLRAARAARAGHVSRASLLVPARSPARPVRHSGPRRSHERRAPTTAASRAQAEARPATERTPPSSPVTRASSSVVSSPVLSRSFARLSKHLVPALGDKQRTGPGPHGAPAFRRMRGWRRRLLRHGRAYANRRPCMPANASRRDLASIAADASCWASERRIRRHRWRLSAPAEPMHRWSTNGPSSASASR
jgi:hypothetical protein